MKLLLLEDELRLQESVSEFLTDIGFVVTAFANGDDAYQTLMSKKFDLIILDVQVPGMNGFEILQRIRQENIQTPVIMTTSLTSMQNLETGYESGCDDYLKKPYELLELKLRINNALKASTVATHKEKIELPLGYVYDANIYELTQDEKVVALTKTEKNIIELFIRNRGKIIDIPTFQDEIWHEDIDSSNIRVQINNLRKKLDKELIVNVRGHGYKMLDS
jgi:DNA-binding response OmpR family regulator